MNPAAAGRAGPPRPWGRWLATMAVAVLVAGGCATAGVWQWHRHEQRSAAVAVLLANADAAPTPVADALADDRVAPDEVWLAVTARGSYLPGSAVLLRNRPVQGQAGLHALAAFRVTEGDLAGTVLVVDRGFLPDARGTDVPEPPGGEIDLVARLRVPERPTERDAPAGQVQVIAPEQVRAAAPTPWQGPTADAYATALTEDGASPADLSPLEQPSTDLGPHLSYAFQWWVFAAGALVGAVILLRRDARSADAGAQDDPAAPDPASRRRRPTAEDEEDALLDAQESAARAAAEATATRDRQTS